jgi:hypothetical protein
MEAPGLREFVDNRCNMQTTREGGSRFRQDCLEAERELFARLPPLSPAFDPSGRVWRPSLPVLLTMPSSRT